MKNANDIVTRVPSLLGYRHVGIEVLLLMILGMHTCDCLEYSLTPIEKPWKMHCTLGLGPGANLVQIILCLSRCA